MSELLSKIFTVKVIRFIYFLSGIIAIGQLVLVILSAMEPQDLNKDPIKPVMDALGFVLCALQLLTAFISGSGLKNISNYWKYANMIMSLSSLALTIVFTATEFSDISFDELMHMDPDMIYFLYLQLFQFAMNLFLCFAERFVHRKQKKNEKVEPVKSVKTNDVKDGAEL